MAKITIDEKEYDTDTFSEAAMSQFNSLQFVQSEINRLQALMSVAKTAQQAYLIALKQIVDND